MHFCIFGCGKIAQVHAQNLKKLARFVPGHPCQFSFASRHPARAREYQERLGGTLAFGSYEEALKCDKIDVVVICAPNDCHHELALRALGANKHVIIEKPITCKTAQADEILALSATHGKKVFVAENFAYRPSIQGLGRLIDSGELGVVKLISINILHGRTFKPDEWRSDVRRMGGGPLIDGGIHWVNALLNLGGGEPVKISALRPPTTVRNCPQEDTLCVLCQFESGTVGALNYSWGTLGTFPIKVVAVHGSLSSAYVATNGLFGLHMRKLPRPLFFPRKDRGGFEAMWKNFLNCLAGREETCLASGEIGRRDLAFVERVGACLEAPGMAGLPGDVEGITA